MGPELKAIVLADANRADKATQNSSARQSVVNQLNYILQKAKLIDEAKQLLTNELSRSESAIFERCAKVKNDDRAIANCKSLSASELKAALSS